MKRLFLLLVLAMFLCVGVSFCVQSKSNLDNEVKFGLGYAKVNLDVPNFGINSLDSVAARMWFSDGLGLDMSLGFSTGDSQTAVLFGAKIIGNFVKINKLNIYWLGGLSIGAYDPKQNGIKSFTVFRIQGGVGAEYYLLNCLSVLTEMGISFTSFSENGNSTSNFGLYSDWLPQAGVRFYFN